ncbi:alpha/beta fold hydrolase [Phenylobacterium sp.]|uniref:alpha/beta fold hydrolase n=1 Tax=Phenylobacterium sp. TaxID=1871053 RepID=UPI003562E053
MTVAIGLALLGMATRMVWPVSTPAFRGPDGRPLPQSVATMERISVNGVPQSVTIRGRDRRNPILIWIHGGPGSSETTALRHYDSGLENHFVVVYWDQRYAGQNYDPHAAKPTALTIQQYVDDLSVVIDTVLTRFGQRKVVLVGHSWGTVPGVLYAQQHPEKVAAYVGVGQVADVPKSERRSYAWALAEARARHDKRGEAQLVALGPPPRPGQPIFTPRDLMMTYGGSFHRDMGYGDLILAGLRHSEANWRDFLAFQGSGEFSNRLTQGEFSRFVMDDRPQVFSTPIFLLSGRYDRQSEASVAHDFYEQVRAPRKAFVWFEQSAHNPPFEQPAALDAWIVRNVRPLASPAGA